MEKALLFETRGNRLQGLRISGKRDRCEAVDRCDRDALNPFEVGSNSFFRESHGQHLPFARLLLLETTTVVADGDRFFQGMDSG